MILTAAQLRAARGLLDWTRTDLAKAANISPETVKNIEHGTFRPQEQTADAIVHAFGIHDVVFTEDEGVKRHHNQVRAFSGQDGYKNFLDHIYMEMQGKGGRICQFNVSDKVIAYTEEYSKIHLDRMSKIANLDARVLVKEGDENFPAKYCLYRWFPKTHIFTIPFYVYGENVSMASIRDGDKREIISIHSKMLSQLYIEQFDAIWEIAKTPPKK